MSSWTAASSDCSRPVNNYVHVKTADLYRPNARLTPERQGYQVLTPFGKLGYSRLSSEPGTAEVYFWVKKRVVQCPRVADPHLVSEFTVKHCLTGFRLSHQDRKRSSRPLLICLCSSGEPRGGHLSGIWHVFERNFASGCAPSSWLFSGLLCAKTGSMQGTAPGIGGTPTSSSSSSLSRSRPG